MVMTMKQLSKDEAVDFCGSEFWLTLTDEQIVYFQMEQVLLCVPFSRYHEAMEKCLRRPVWTHEFADSDNLRDELKGKISAPSFEEILAKLPANKAIILAVSDEE